MTKIMKDNVSRMKEAVTKISQLVADIEKMPDYMKQFNYNYKNDELHTNIVRLYSLLGAYHRENATLSGMSREFPSSVSGLTEIQEVNDDYIRIKMPMLYRKNKDDSILNDDLNSALWAIQKAGIGIPFMERKEIIITFHYSASTEKEYIRDNDNYAIKSILNTIVRHMRCTDSGDSTWLSIRAVVVEDDIENHTIIEVKRMA